jgi:hypothetical protein
MIAATCGHRNGGGRASLRANYFVHAPLKVWQYRPERQSPNRRDPSSARHTQIALTKPPEQVEKWAKLRE